MVSELMVSDHSLTKSYWKRNIPGVLWSFKKLDLFSVIFLLVASYFPWWTLGMRIGWMEYPTTFHGRYKLLLFWNKLGFGVLLTVSWLSQQIKISLWCLKLLKPEPRELFLDGVKDHLIPSTLIPWRKTDLRKWICSFTHSVKHLQKLGF